MYLRAYKSIFSLAGFPFRYIIIIFYSYKSIFSLADVPFRYTIIIFYSFTRKLSERKCVSIVTITTRRTRNGFDPYMEKLEKAVPLFIAV